MKKTFTLLALITATYSNAQNISTIAGNGTSGFSGDGGPATSAVLKNPTGVAVDAQGNVYIADSFNGRIRKITASTGIITTVAGGAGYGFTGDGGPATSAKMTYPSDVAVDSQGNLYISDNANYRIRKVTASTGIITTIAGTGASGNSGDGGLADTAKVSAGQMTFDSQDNLYFSTGQSIRKISASTGIITTVAGTGTAGFSGDGGQATAAKLYSVGSMVVDANGNIYIADQGNYRVRKVDGSTGIITTIVNQSGTNSYFGDGGLATAAEMTGPYGLALDAQNNLFISDENNHRIRRVDASTNIITTIAGNGSGNYSGDGGPATSAQLLFPADLAIDAQNNIYITEGYVSLPTPGYRVRKIDGTPNAIAFNSNRKERVSVYPNPSSGVYNFSGSEEIQTLKIYNLLGKLVLDVEVKNRNVMVDLSGNTAGFYFYQITDKKNQIQSGKIMLK